MDKDNNNITKEEYVLKINEKQNILTKKANKKIDKEINFIFETANQTDVIQEVLRQLSKYYIEDTLKLKN